MHSMDRFVGSFAAAKCRADWRLWAYTPFAELQIEAIAYWLVVLELCNEPGFSFNDRESRAQAAVQRLCDLDLARGVAISHNDGPSRIAVDYVGPLPRDL